MAGKSIRRKLIFWTTKMPVAALCLAVVGCNLWIVSSTQSRVFKEATEVENRPVAVVLGTSKKIGPNEENPHFQNRIAAAAELYLAGRVDKLLVSGHRNSQYYDEPRDMISRLRDIHDIPESAVIGDGKGHRTLDSIRRAKEVYGFDKVVVISDDFHVNRALFIADRIGLDAIAYRSQPVELDIAGPTRMREYLARVKAVMDFYLPIGKPESERIAAKQ